MYTFVVFIYLFITCDSLNLCPKFAQIISYNNSKSYFGYSVLLRAPTTNYPASVVVGAPRANSSFSLHRNVVEPGAVFSCSLSSLQCKQFLLNPQGNTLHKGTSGYSYHHLKDHGWLGSAVEGSNVTNGMLITCAPRWSNQVYKTNRFLNGVCYALTTTDNTEKTADELMPLLYSAHQGFTLNSDLYYFYAFGQAGFSIHITKNNSEILLGAPGILQWKGMVIKYSYDNMKEHLPTNSKSSRFHDVRIPNPYYSSKLIQESYFGYAVTSGRFLNNSDVVWYVGGAPRGNDLFGQVLLFEYSNTDPINDPLIHHELKGSQLGEYFGSVLTVVDINNDGADDLLVGAPLYTREDAIETGCIYYYLNDGEGILRPRRIVGTPNYRSRFGSAISVIGDMNKDGYPDIVVSAPFYENGKGAIFIYFGNQKGLNRNYQQKILASDIDNNLRAFGSSLSRGVDIDGNNYNDIAVGSYLSGHVVIIKSQPITTLRGSLSSNLTKFTIETTSFSITSCLKYTGVQLPSKLKVNVLLEADASGKRVVFSKNNMYLLNTTNEYKYNIQSCETSQVTLLNMKRDFVKPLYFKMTYQLTQYQDQDSFCSSCPVLDENQQNYAVLEIPFHNGCKSNETCRPDLKLSAKYNYNKPTLVIGSEDKLDVVVDILNLGEPAFNCILHVHLMSDIFLEKMPEDCKLTDKTLICLVANPLQTDRKKILEFKLDISTLTSQTNLIIEMNVTSSGIEVNQTNNDQIINLPLKIEKNIVILGSSKPKTYVYVDSEKIIRTSNLTVTHNFIVENLGPSPAGYSELKFYIPYKVNGIAEPAIKIFEPMAYLDDQSILCLTTNTDGFAKNNEKSLKDVEITDLKNLRDKRSVESFHSAKQSEEINDGQTTSLQKYLSNRTIYLNCNSSDFSVVCFEVKCITTPLKKIPTFLRLDFTFNVNINLLDELDESKDIIIISSVLELTSEDIIKSLEVHTVLHGSQKEDSPLKWIIIGIIIGMIILAILIYSLYRFEFFKRTAHEKLQNEKGGILDEYETMPGDTDMEDN